MKISDCQKPSQIYKLSPVFIYKACVVVVRIAAQMLVHLECDTHTVCLPNFSALIQINFLMRPTFNTLMKFE